MNKKNFLSSVSILLTWLFFAPSVWGAISEPESKPEPVISTLTRPLWKKKASISVNLSQNSFSNWSKGGDNAFSWLIDSRNQFILVSGGIELELNGKFTFGRTKLQNLVSRKTTDEISVESVLRWKNKPGFQLFFSMHLQTQFAPGYDDKSTPARKISNFFDPAFLSHSLGLSFKRSDLFDARLGFGLKHTFTRRFSEPYTDNPDTHTVERYLLEIGLNSTANLNWKISPDLTLTSKLEMFSNLKEINTVDVNWDNLLTARFSRFFSFSISFELKYDRDLSKLVQTRQAIMAGIMYSFFSEAAPASK